MQTSRRAFLASAAATAVALRGAKLLNAQNSAEASITVLADEPIATIAPEVQGHFIEQLGGVVYDGVWVGKNSKIPNITGIRKDFIDTMRAVNAPVLRWPGGCFADSYDWRDGIGPKRPQRTAFWKQEDANQYGTHEFMHTCRAIGCEPYLAADLRALPARDFYQWVEYCNAPAGIGNDLAAQRAANGDKEPFNVKYWGVGNESWGCGGDQTPEEYAGEYRRFANWLPTYPQVKTSLVACGPNGDDIDWSRRLAAGLRGHLPWGLSTHYYTSGNPGQFAKGEAVDFTLPEFYDLLARASIMDRVILDAWSAYGENDKAHRTKLVVDEWGAWYGDSTRLGPKYNLSQQITLRDALHSGITFDIFHRHADKMGMANVAQSINCLHSLMLAQEDKFVRTPIFHVFRLYMAHQGGTSLRTEVVAPSIQNTIAQTSPVGGASTVGSTAAQKTLSGLSASASRKGNILTLSVTNTHHDRPLTTTLNLPGLNLRTATAEVLTHTDIHAHNTFAEPNNVTTKPTTVAASANNAITHTFPAASVTTITLTLA
jgi:alpha-L-arabinofuranosidase